MAKDKRRSKSVKDTTGIPDELESELAEAARALEASGADGQPEIPVASDVQGDKPVQEDQEDLLEGLRRTLMQNESEQEEVLAKKWWSRPVKQFKYEDASDAQEASESEPESSASLDTSTVDLIAEEETKTEIIDDTITPMTSPESGEQSFDYESQSSVGDQTMVESPDLDIEELKKRAFQPRVSSGEAEEIAEIRSIVAEGADAFVEVSTQSSDVIEDRVVAIENALRPYKRIVYSGIALFALILLGLVGFLGFRLYQTFLPDKTPKEAVVVPYPVTLTLPGGLNFDLGKGKLNKGDWNPQGPEWLEGTEICRWVAIPWSTQMEAVVKTLQPKDAISLGMSNHDELVYKVDSVRERSTAQLQKLDRNSPCLLLILAKSETDSRWVITALP